MCIVGCLLQEACCTQLSQDLNKQKEEVNSFNIELKWAQNKLRTESEVHKVCVHELIYMIRDLAKGGDLPPFRGKISLMWSEIHNML